MTATYGDAMYGAGLYSAQETAASNLITGWAFVLDGHFFYVLNLGIQGTLVCDIANGNAWYEWNYYGSVGFPAREGCNVEDLYLFGGKDDGQIYYFDPTSFMDDNFPIESYTTAVYPVRGLAQKPCYEFTVDGTLSGNELVSAILLTSDDNGATFDVQDTIVSDGSASELQWQSLGSMQSPGRIFQVFDMGVFSQINTFCVDVGQ